MNDQALSRILEDCLALMAEGESASACLARYPEHAAELAPLLALAGELGALERYRLSAGARQRAHARLRAAAAARDARRGSAWWRPGAFFAPRAAAGLVMALFCVILLTGVVAASQPGDLAYGLRVSLERTPALLAAGPESRARAELGIAARRLADLDRTMRSQQTLDARTVSALLVSAESAAALAADLAEAERAQVAARLAEQAEVMTQLREMARQPEQAEALRLAAERMRRAAERVQGVPAPGPSATPVGPGPNPTSPGPGGQGH